MRSLRDVLITEFGLGASLVEWSLYCATASLPTEKVSWAMVQTRMATRRPGLRLAAEPTLPGDFNHDGTVDAADYIVWRKTDGTPAGYNTWRANFGQPAGSGSGRRCECHRSRTGNVGDAYRGGCWLVSPATPGRIKSPNNSSTRDTGQQTTLVTHVF